MPDLPAARRRAVRLTAGLVAAATVLLAGCAKMDAALSQQWVTVNFKANTTVATLLHVRKACSHVPNVTATPIHRTRAAIDMIDALRYDTTNASDANLAQLQECLQKFPSVAGLDFQNAGGD